MKRKSNPISLIKQVGNVPLCNKRKDTAPHLGSFCFPLCWRCFGCLIGFLILNLIPQEMMNPNTLLGALLLLPIGIDGGLQYLRGVESNNKKRFITGILGVLGLGMLIRG